MIQNTVKWNESVSCMGDLLSINIVSLSTVIWYHKRMEPDYFSDGRGLVLQHPQTPEPSALRLPHHTGTCQVSLTSLATHTLFTEGYILVLLILFIRAKDLCNNTPPHLFNIN